MSEGNPAPRSRRPRSTMSAASPSSSVRTGSPRGSAIDGSGRRTVLTAILATALISATLIGLVLFSASSSPSTCGGPVQADPATTTPIQHLFVIVKENHAFENYFGGFPGVTGYPPNGSLPLTLNGGPTVHPFPLTGSSTDDFPHDAVSSLTDYNNGQNNLFVAVANAAGNYQPQDAAGYYGPSQLPGYYAYAQNYSLGDHFFTGFLGPTFPNRVFDITAYAGSWGTDTPPPVAVTEQPTILDQLNHARIPWDYDWSFSSFELAPTFFPSIASNLCDSGGVVPVSSLPSQLSSGTAPAVVYVDPSDDATFSEHPPANITVGEQWTVGLVNTIFSSPVANSSAVLIFFDESGGYWDPVPPPITSTGRDGFRVPFLVLSPWTPAGKICTETLDPASVLRFIDDNWKLPYLNSRVSTATNLSCFFNFASPPRPPPLLPTPITFAVSRSATILLVTASGSVVAPNPPAGRIAAVWRERTTLSESFWSPGLSFFRQEVEGS